MTDFSFEKTYLNMMLLGAQKGYPPWVVSSPQIKTRTPQLENHHPSIPMFVFLLAAFAIPFFLQGLDQDCIASGFLIHLRQMFLVQFFTFQDAKTHQKKGILKWLISN